MDNDVPEVQLSAQKVLFDYLMVFDGLLESGAGREGSDTHPQTTGGRREEEDEEDKQHELAAAPAPAAPTAEPGESTPLAAVFERLAQRIADSTASSEHRNNAVEGVVSMCVCERERVISLRQ